MAWSLVEEFFWRLPLSDRIFRQPAIYLRTDNRYPIRIKATYSVSGLILNSLCDFCLLSGIARMPDIRPIRYAVRLYREERLDRVDWSMSLCLIILYLVTTQDSRISATIFYLRQIQETSTEMDQNCHSAIEQIVRP